MHIKSVLKMNVALQKFYNKDMFKNLILQPNAICVNFKSSIVCEAH